MAKKPRVLKKAPVSFREQVDKKGSKPEKPRRLRKAGRVASAPFRGVWWVRQKQLGLIKEREKGVGKFLTKRRSPVPGYFRNSWREVRQVTWPGRRETWKLTFAVFVFAISFGLVVAVVDYGLDKLFRKVILKI